MKKIVVACLLLLGVNAYSQGRGILDVFQNTQGSALRNVVEDKKKENAIGSPYVNESYLNTQIAGTNNVLQTRYNAYTDEIEVKYDDAIFVVPKEEQYKTIYYKLTDSRLQLMRYKPESGEPVYGYLFELFIDNEFGLYKRERVTYQDAKEPTNGYATATPPKYNKKSPEYLIKLNDSEVVPFPKNKKALIALFSGKEELISNYLKAEKISFKDEEDLLKLTKFLKTL